MPKVSVVVPIYNVEEYLDLALESVKRQTLKDIEIICVNDGSTDRSLEIIRKWAEGDDRFVIIDKKNGGYGVAMNTGIERATGEYIGILEPDDFLPLHMFEDLYKAAKDHDLDIVKADFYRFTTGETGNVRLVYNKLDASGEWYDKVVDPSMTPELTRFIMNTWAGIYKRSFLIDNDIKHNTTPGASFQDNGFFWKTTVCAKKAMFINRPYYLNRRDNPNSSVNSKGKVYAANVEYDYIRDYLMDNKDPEVWERFKYYYNLKRFDNYMFTLARISEEFKKEYVERIYGEFRRSDELGELDMAIFDEKRKAMLESLLKDRKYFYAEYAVIKPKKKQTVQSVKNSTTYKIGSFITFVPRKVKKIIMSRG